MVNEARGAAWGRRGVKECFGKSLLVSSVVERFLTWRGTQFVVKEAICSNLLFALSLITYWWFHYLHKISGDI